jgi:hypothetical protein
VGGGGGLFIDAALSPGASWASSASSLLAGFTISGVSTEGKEDMFWRGGSIDDILCMGSLCRRSNGEDCGEIVGGGNGKREERGREEKKLFNRT